MRGEAGEAGGEAGFVLVSVLALVALFVAAAAGLAVRSHLHLLQAGRAAEAARLEAVADGVALFVADALRVGAGAQERDEIAAALPLDGRPIVCRLTGAEAPGGDPGGPPVEIRIADAGGLLDLNAAPPAMMLAVFTAAGLDGRSASALADEIAALRTGQADGTASGLRPGPFLDADEVASLRNATAARRVRPLLTVDNPRPSLDWTVTEIAARALLPRDAAERPALQAWSGVSPAEVFRIDAALLGEDGVARAGRRAVVHLADSRAGAPQVRRWSRPPFDETRRDPGQGASPEHPLCAPLRTALGRVLP